MSETPTRREQQRQERRKQILEAALAVFSERGFHASNVSDVAAAAGVSQGTIYWYFESKEDLFNAAVVSYFDEFGRDTLATFEGPKTSAGKLRELARAMAGLAGGAEGLFTLFLEYWASSARREEVGQLWADLLTEYKDAIVTIIEEGVRRGEFRPVQVEPLVWAMMAAYDGLAAYMLLVPGLDLAKISEAFVEALLEGLVQA